METINLGTIERYAGRNKKCPCREPYTVLIPESEYGYSVMVDKSLRATIYYYDRDPQKVFVSPIAIDFTMAINYCPFCGRKLRRKRVKNNG